MPILALATEIVSLLPSMISAGMDVAKLVGSVRTVIADSAPPNDAAWAKLDADVSALEAELQIDP